MGPPRRTACLPSSSDSRSGLGCRTVGLEARTAAPGAGTVAPGARTVTPGARIGAREARSAVLPALAAAGLLTAGVLATSVHAQEPVDSVEVLEEVRELQEEFERFRESRTPIQRGDRPDGVCDENIGRICIWFGGEDEASFPRELDEVGEARIELIRALSRAFRDVPHRWTLGQLVHYLVESRNVDEAERLASECGIEETWWCWALHGYVLHMRNDYVEAEVAFREALEAMPAEEREEWISLRYVLTDDGRDVLDELSPEERERRWELFWTLSDPLFLYEGNDRLTDHFARWVVAKNRREAADPLGLEWDEDLEATLVRYGRNIGYSRTHDPSRMMSGGLQDTRRMTGHHHPRSRGYLFPEEFLEAPADVPPESWITAPREARTWYAPLYAPDMLGLETQVGRFRRDDAMLVVGAYRPTLVEDVDRGERAIPDFGAASGGDAPWATLFLVPESGEPPVNVRSREAEGVLTIQAPPGRYVSGLEVVDVQERRAWRARQGIVQEPLTPGLVGVSDLMILEEDAPVPESLEEALPHIRPGIRVRNGERFPVIWEVYGLRIQEPVRVTLGFSRGRPGFLERVGEFLGVIEPETNVDVTFDDTGPDQVQAIFRSVEIALPAMEPGEYTLHLRLELPGRTPVVTSRPIVVEG